MFRFSVSRESRFSSAHQLRGYDGPCENLHGHNYRARATVAASQLDKLGMVVDFKLLGAELDRLVDQLDHVLINEVEPFDKTNPTAENLASWLLSGLSDALDDERVQVSKVELWETDRSVVTVERLD